MAYMIGIDGGGSKTSAIVVDETGKIMAQATAGSTNLNSTHANIVQASMEQLVAKLAAQVEQLHEQTRFIYGGFAGAYHIQNANALQHILSQHFPNAELTVSDDAMIALYAGTYGKPGIVQIVGTGSGTYGISVDGTRLRAGGWGYIIDDVGSGYAIGNAAMQAVFRAYDKRGKPTALTAALLAHFQESDVPALIGHVYKGDAKTVLAPLSRYVSEAAARGDAVSDEVIQQAATHIAHSLNTVAAQFGATSVPVVQVGSVWQAHQFETYVRAAVQFEAQWIRPQVPAEVGAIFALAQQQQLLEPAAIEAHYKAFQQQVEGRK